MVEVIRFLETKSHNCQQEESRAQESHRLAGIFLVLGYQALGKTDEMQKWLHSATGSASVEEAAYLKFQYAISPPLSAIYGTRKSTFPVSELRQINAEVQPYLPLLANNRHIISPLGTLVGEQIKAGQIAEARQIVTILENVALTELTSGKSMGNFSGATSVARILNDRGDRKRSNEWLQQLIDLPQEAWGKWCFSKADHISAIIQWGFTDEGLRLFLIQ